MKEMIYGEGENRVTCLVDDIYKDIQYVVLNICGSHPCCYVNLPEDHPWVGLLDFDDAYYNVPVECHGGLTFNSDHLDVEWHLNESKTMKIVDNVIHGNWIGWDYAHSGDFTWYPVREPFYEFEKAWTTAELIADCKKVIDQVVEAYEK